MRYFYRATTRAHAVWSLAPVELEGRRIEIDRPIYTEEVDSKKIHFHMTDFLKASGSSAVGSAACWGKRLKVYDLSVRFPLPVGFSALTEMEPEPIFSGLVEDFLRSFSTAVWRYDASFD